MSTTQRGSSLFDIYVHIPDLKEEGGERRYREIDFCASVICTRLEKDKDE